MKITVAGGDLRMKTVRKLFLGYGFDCNENEIETKKELIDEIKSSDAVVLPTPCSKNGFLNAPFIAEEIPLSVLFSAGGEKTLFIGGMIPEKGENKIDYATDEAFLIKNAVPTAEGAVSIAMQETETTLHGANVLVVGFGRIGNYLAKILKDLGANTCVAVRSEKSKANAEVFGHKTINVSDMAESLSEADAVFNTVPFLLFKEKELSALKKDAFIIDLASLPGGVDKEIAEKKKVKVIHALGLPGKYSPETAGRIVFETVLTILRERGFSV